MAGMTVKNALAVPALRAAGPVVLAGAAGLVRTVHWVHTTELADIGPLLRGGDLVLTTASPYPEAPRTSRSSPKALTAATSPDSSSSWGDGGGRCPTRSQLPANGCPYRWLRSPERFGSPLWRRPSVNRSSTDSLRSSGRRSASMRSSPSSASPKRARSRSSSRSSDSRVPRSFSRTSSRESWTTARARATLRPSCRIGGPAHAPLCSTAAPPGTTRTAGW